MRPLATTCSSVQVEPAPEIHRDWPDPDPSSTLGAKAIEMGQEGISAPARRSHR